METMVRTHVMLPKALLEEADGRLGKRKRSELITSLLAEWVRRERLSAAIDAVLAHQPGPLDDNVPEEWKTSEGAAKWVHDLRRLESGRDRVFQEWTAEIAAEDAGRAAHGG